MKIRVVSDLHVDVNDMSEQEYDWFKFTDQLNETDVLLIAGDTAGSSYKEQNFYKYLRSKTEIPIIVVGGNHLGYDYIRYRQINAIMNYNNPLDQTKEDCIKQLKKDKNITFLDNTYIELDNYIVFGGTMYSNFLLYGSHKDACMNTAERWLNDFRYVYTFDKKTNTVRPVTAVDYIKWFNKFMRNLKKCIKETNKDIIVLTHFAPSIKSIDSKYLNRPNRFSSPGSEINAVYASPLEEFLLDNPRIKLWVHGHVHSSFNYNIGQCNIICEPYGYYYEHGISQNEYTGKVLEI